MSASATYIVRLDDACASMDRKRWDRVERVLERARIPAIVAVVPQNVDPFLQREASDPDFWGRVRHWQEKGWHVALHGYRHEALTRRRGLVPLHHKSEFAGLPVDVQRGRLRAAIGIFREERIDPRIWVAPFHTFDANTLEALAAETEIRIVSDGVASLPYRDRGFFWIPQQLWDPRPKAAGVWTICLHPNDMTECALEALESFVNGRIEAFRWDLETLQQRHGRRRRSLADRASLHALVCRRGLESLSAYRAAVALAVRVKRKLVRGG